MVKEKEKSFFLCILRGKICFAKGLDFWSGQSYHTDDKNSLDTVVSPYRGSIFLTTVYPTDTLGVHGNSGDKSAGKHLFPSGKGRKCPEISGNRYSGFLWDSVEKWRIMTSSSLGESPYFMRSPAFAYHSNLSLVWCLTTVIPLYFHFKNWLNFVQQQN